MSKMRFIASKPPTPVSVFLFCFFLRNRTSGTTKSTGGPFGYCKFSDDCDGCAFAGQSLCGHDVGERLSAILFVTDRARERVV